VEAQFARHADSTFNVSTARSMNDTPDPPWYVLWMLTSQLPTKLGVLRRSVFTCFKPATLVDATIALLGLGKHGAGDNTHARYYRRAASKHKLAV
jgi:hypothetical protein